MSDTIEIRLNVTPSQKETIDARVLENGFNEISAYLKVVALKTQPFIFTPADVDLYEEASIKVCFEVTAVQQKKIEENLKASACETLDSYLLYVALHGIVTAVAEVRSTGNLEAMLARIAESRKR